MLNTRPFRSILRTLPAWVAMIAMCIQPMLVLAADCTCGDSAIVMTAAVDGCCGQQSSGPSTLGDSCCPLDQVSAIGSAHQEANDAGCCCDPTSDVCQCNGCSCSIEQDAPDAPPAIPPINESSETQNPTLLNLFPLSNLPLIATSSHSDVRRIAFTLPTQTAQQTCVLLSRFTC